jgi:hypothetical protein
MPWCPKCRFEYRPQLTHCPECGSWLVAELPPKPEPEGEEGFEQVLLCSVTGDTHRALIQGALTAAGIRSREQVSNSDLSVFTRGYPAPMVNVYSIYVNRRDLAQAQKVYRAYERRSK